MARRTKILLVLWGAVASVLVIDPLAATQIAAKGAEVCAVAVPNSLNGASAPRRADAPAASSPAGNRNRDGSG